MNDIDNKPKHNPRDKAFRKFIQRAIQLIPPTPQPVQGWILIVPYYSALTQKGGIHISAQIDGMNHLLACFEGLTKQCIQAGVPPQVIADIVSRAVVEFEQSKKIVRPNIVVPGDFSKKPS